MAAREIKTTLALDGEKQFKAGMDDAYRAMKVLGSEMKVNTAEFGKNAQSMDGLVGKQKNLTSMQEQQKKIVEALNKAVEESAQAYGESDKRTDAYRIKLNNAKASLVGIESQLEQTNTDIQNFGQQTEVASKKSIDWKNALGQVDAALESGIKGLTTALAGVVAFGAGVVAVGKQAFDLTVVTGQLADELLTMSAQTGISTQALQEWGYAAQFIDVEVETMTGSMAKMIRQLTAAKEGTGASAEAFASLGVSITDSSGQLLNSQDIFFAAIDALGQIANETERDALAMQIFGKSAQDLNPLILAGSDQLRALGLEAQNLGIVMSDSTVTAFGAFDDSMNVMNSTIQSVKQNFVTAMLPAMESITKVVQDVATQFNNWLKTDGAQALLASLTGKVSDLATDLGNNLTPIIEGVIGAFDTIIKTVGFVIDNIGTLKTVAIALVGTLATLKVAQIAVNLAMAANPMGLIVTAIGLVVTAAVALIQNWDAVKTAISNVWESIKGAFNAGVSAVTGFIGNIVKSFGDLVTGAWNAGKNLVSGIWKGIQSAANWLSDQITGWLSGMWKGIKSFFGINSPSTLMAETIGKPMVQGMALGIAGNAGLIDKAMAGIMPSAVFSSVDMNINRRFNDVVSATASGQGGIAQAVAAGVEAAMRKQGDTVLVMNDREMARYIRRTAPSFA